MADVPSMAATPADAVLAASTHAAVQQSSKAPLAGHVSCSISVLALPKTGQA